MKEYFEKLYSGTAKDFADEMAKVLSDEGKAFVVTANPETLMIAEDNPAFKKALLNDRTRIVPDGIGLVKAASFYGMNIPERVTGVELSQFLLNECGRMGKSVYLYGAKPEVLELLCEKLKKEHNVNIVGSQNGYGNNDEEVFADIMEKKPDLVLVALGIPRQELLIDKYFDAAEKGIFIGVGGSFDVLSGSKKRAPAIFVKLNLEWLYRITKEPKRLKRFYDSNVKFISKIRKEIKK